MDFGGYEVPVDNSVIDELSPTGLWMPIDSGYEVLRPGIHLPTWMKSSIWVSESLWSSQLMAESRLAKLWDSRGLLYIHQDERIMSCPWKMAKVFNVFRNLECDRQIGDRRGMNFAECRVVGPSVDLLQGVHLSVLEVDVSKDVLVTAVTDRRDFYHQLKISEQKALWSPG